MIKVLFILKIFIPSTLYVIMSHSDRNSLHSTIAAKVFIRSDSTAIYWICYSNAVYFDLIDEGFVVAIFTEFTLGEVYHFTISFHKPFFSKSHNPVTYIAR